MCGSTAADTGIVKCVISGGLFELQPLHKGCASFPQQRVELPDAERVCIFCFQESQGAECVSKLGALEADIQAVTQRLARISSDSSPALPASMQQAMALAQSRKRKSCDILATSEPVGGSVSKRGHSLDNSRSGWHLLCAVPFMFLLEGTANLESPLVMLCLLGRNHC